MVAPDGRLEWGLAVAYRQYPMTAAPFGASVCWTPDEQCCEVCRKADNAPQMLLCDGCDGGWHLRPQAMAVRAHVVPRSGTPRAGVGAWVAGPDAM
ncbi:hypothetical protein HXX76_003715 [Chlamydomonas incerta]|uniref:PHD-type domain-containing protein n=1 Tax=Chlamydomonas incerta TaxID=51695 RepID=A0A835W954_CHLIN|nr:hypothetical protein HXX76_003715 [Chlamydomonas incerta]|eukprot:KAG2440861.1 hypothetical protein HXX76_003715 [Chlamydomonas incerta]